MHLRLPHTLKQPLLALWLSVLLLMGQLGSIAHSAQHLAEHDQDRPHTVCELCAAYASLDGATPPPAALPLALDLADTALPVSAAPRAGTLTHPPYHSRAPPRLA